MADERPASAGSVDVCAEVACSACGQVNVGQTGEHPCVACGLPTLHDPDSADELPSLEEARRELRAEGIDPDELGRRMRERVESMLRAVTLAPTGAVDPGGTLGEAMEEALAAAGGALPHSSDTAVAPAGGVEARPAIDGCCDRLRRVLRDDERKRPTVRVEMSMDMKTRRFLGERVAWHFLIGRRNRFVWLDFCPFCGVKLPRGHA